MGELGKSIEQICIDAEKLFNRIAEELAYPWNEESDQRYKFYRDAYYEHLEELRLRGLGAVLINGVYRNLEA